MKAYKKVIAAAVMGLALPFAYGDSLSISKDGIYVLNEKFPLGGQDTVYIVSGKVEASGMIKDGIYFNLGLVPYDAEGKPLIGRNEFPLPTESLEDHDGFMVLEQLLVEKDGQFEVNLKVRFDGESMKSVSFVAETILMNGSKFELKDFSIAPIASDVQMDSTANGVESNKSSKPTSYAYVGNRDVISGAELKQSEESASNKSGQTVAGSSRRYIYVHPELGSDNFHGFKKLRGQIDGPKRTLRSAVNKAGNGDVIVLQESNTPHKIRNTIISKPGQNIVIRADGKVVIKAEGRID